MANYLTTDTDLTAVADAIRAKGGTSAQLAFPADFLAAIEAISTGGGNQLIDRLNLTLTSFESNEVTRIPDYGFYGCSALVSLKIPNAHIVGFHCIEGTKIKTLVLPDITAQSNNWNVFQKCSTLEKLDIFPKSNIYNFAQYNFQNDSNLTEIIIRGGTYLRTLGSLNNFNGTPFASGGTGGTLYVPSAMIASYQSATNWSTILGYETNQILPIEGSIYETQYADGTPIPTT